MIEVVKYGSKKRVTCPGCGSILSYDENEDVEKETFEELNLNPYGMCERYTKHRKYIKCPVCKQQIILERKVEI